MEDRLGHGLVGRRPLVAESGVEGGHRLVESWCRPGGEGGLVLQPSGQEGEGRVGFLDDVFVAQDVDRQAIETEGGGPDVVVPEGQPVLYGQGVPALEGECDGLGGTPDPHRSEVTTQNRPPEGEQQRDPGVLQDPGLRTGIRLREHGVQTTLLGSGCLTGKFPVVRWGIPGAVMAEQQRFVEQGNAQALPVLRVRLQGVNPVAFVDPLQAEGHQRTGDR